MPLTPWKNYRRPSNAHHVAVLSPDEDPSEYIGGALAVMLAVADDVYELVEKLRKDAEDVAA